MELEGVGGVAVGDLRLEVGGQVDDGDGAKRTFLGADATTDAERLREVGDARVGGDLNAELSGADDGACLLALLTTLLGLAFVAIDNSDTGEFVNHCCCCSSARGLVEV